MLTTLWPGVRQLVNQLFASRWLDLFDQHSKLHDIGFPGVYLLAYSTKQLQGNRVRPKDVFYVGMTHAGLSKRLNQFMKGIENGQHHSGAKRFFIENTKRKGFKRLRSKKRFFVASLSIKCNYKKSGRTPEDLRRMGLVTALEYYVLAHLREKLGKEPKLNKK